MEEQVEKPKRNAKVTTASKKLLDLIAALPKPDFRKLKVRINEIFKVARKEGYPDNATGILIRQELEPHYSESTIRRVLPSTAKHTAMIRNTNEKTDIANDIAVNLTANEHETENENITNTEESKAVAEAQETEGRENTKRNNPFDFDNYFKLIDNGTEYIIDSKKLKDVSTDIKDKMIVQLIGGMEFLQSELEQSLKQVEELRKLSLIHI